MGVALFHVDGWKEMTWIITACRSCFGNAPKTPVTGRHKGIKNKTGNVRTT